MSQSCCGTGRHLGDGALQRLKHGLACSSVDRRWRWRCGRSLLSVLHYLHQLATGCIYLLIDAACCSLSLQVPALAAAPPLLTYS